MTEEQVTKAIMKWLDQNKWKIYSFDFPQSGAPGIRLHPDNTYDKTKNMIVPDIIAYKDHFLLIMENKDKYYKNDFIKLNELKYGNTYCKSLKDILDKTKTTEIKIGIGLPEIFKKKCEKMTNLIDLILCVSDDLKCYIAYGFLL